MIRVNSKKKQYVHIFILQTVMLCHENQYYLQQEEN